MIAYKIVKVLSKGPIYAKGGVYGPIETPYKEDVRTIFNMISRGVRVVEVLRSGAEIELTPSNFDKNNDKTVVIKSETPVDVVIPPVNNKEESVVKVIENEEKGAESEKVEETEPVQNNAQKKHEHEHNHNHNNNNKYNQKNNKYNNQKNVVADELESK